MTILIVLVILSLLLGSSFLGAYIWSVRSKQYEDQEGASMRILMDDEVKK